MRVYLDNAATSWPKPECVYEAVDDYQRNVGASAGRGAYREAVAAQQVVDAARRGCAAILGATDPTRVALASNGTDALNLAIHGLLRPHDHVVATVCEHNSVIRPLADAQGRLGVTTTFVGCDSRGYVDPDQVRQAIRSDTRLVIVSHASNVTGAIQPLAEITHQVHTQGALLLLDAAQTLGHVPVDVDELRADLVAASGHKGLLGPLGTGLLYIRPGLESEVRPIRQGGTGSESSLESQPETLPNRYESGNFNMPALAGLAAAAEFLRQEGVEAIAQKEHNLCLQLIRRLESIEGVAVHGPGADDSRVGVVSFSVEGYDPREFALALDAVASVQTRAGLHCAPRMHQSLGTEQAGGLVRMSLGWSTTPQQVDAALIAVESLAAAS